MANAPTYVYQYVIVVREDDEPEEIRDYGYVLARDDNHARVKAVVIAELSDADNVEVLVRPF